MSIADRNKSDIKIPNQQLLISDEKIELIIKNITLKRPRNPYTQFVMKEKEKLAPKNKNGKYNIKELNLKLSEEWKKLKDSEKKKYQKLYEEEKAKFKSDILVVRHYLFKDFNENLQRVPTAYRLYLNEKLIEGFQNHLDPKIIKKEAMYQWEKMSEEEKNVYEEKKNENTNWFIKVMKIKEITPITLFIQKKVEEAKEKDMEPPKVEEIGPAWKMLTKNEKKTYEIYAQELSDEKEKLNDIYDIVNGIKPKKPVGAFKMFLQEKVKKGEKISLQDAIKIWRKLSEDEKDKYLKKSHRCILAYKYKKMIFQKKIKKIYPKKPKGPLQQFLKEKKGIKPPNREKWLTYWTTVYKKLTIEEKKKYEEKCKKARETYKKKMEKFEDKIFDIPKKPISAYLMYVHNRMIELQNQKPNEHSSNLLKIIDEEWKNDKATNKEEYIKKAKNELEIFKKELNEFNKLGYYIKSRKVEKNIDLSDITEIEKREKFKRRSSIKTACRKSKKDKSCILDREAQKEQPSSQNNKIKKIGKSQKYKK